MTNTIRTYRHPFSSLADGSEAALTLTEIRGAADGPTIGISGAIHGNESTGTEVIVELFRWLADKPVKGRLLLLPVANPWAFARNRRHTPIDELNLNREFPGQPGGTLTQQLAAAITAAFLEKIDVHIDLHSGTDRPTVDYVYIFNDERLSRAFGSRLLYRPKDGVAGTMFGGTTKSVTLDRRGIPVTVVELGGGILDQRPYVQRGLAGVINMLKTLGTLAGDPTPPPRQIVVRGIELIRPTRGGFLETLAPPLGEEIAGGSLLGRVVSPYTFQELEQIPSPVKRGIMILSHLTRNLVEPGDYGYMVGDMEGAEA